MAAEQIGRHHPEVGVLVLSQYLEVTYAMRLVEDREARRGYLLKDRVSEIETLLDAIRRVAHGGTVVDPAIVEELVPRTGGSGPGFITTGRSTDTRLTATWATGPYP